MGVEEVSLAGEGEGSDTHVLSTFDFITRSLSPPGTPHLLMTTDRYDRVPECRWVPSTSNAGVIQFRLRTRRSRVLAVREGGSDR